MLVSVAGSQIRTPSWVRCFTLMRVRKSAQYRHSRGELATGLTGPPQSSVYDLEDRHETSSPAEDRSVPCRETPKFCDRGRGSTGHKGEGCRKNLSRNKTILR